MNLYCGKKIKVIVSMLSRKFCFNKDLKISIIVVFSQNFIKTQFTESRFLLQRMVISDDNGSFSGSEAAQQPISARRTQSEKKREKNRQRNERNRANPVYQARKKERDRKRRNAKRNKRNEANPEYRARKNAKKHERDKANEEYQKRKKDRERTRKNMKKNNRNKKDPEYQERKKLRQNRKKNAKKHVKRVKYSNRVVEYERMLKNGHDRVCVCCGQLFAEISIVVNPQQCILAIEKDLQLIVVRQIGWISELQLCFTCSNAIAKGKVPKLCLINGLDFPPIPDELKGLSQLEHRLISARIPFMQLRELRPTTQLGIRGNKVNVPIDIEQSVNILPRDFDRTSTIQLAFKRRLQYKGSYFREWIRPRSDQDKISVEMKRLEQEAKWTIPLPMVSKVREDFSLIIGYQNLPHLYKSAALVVADNNLAACDILCFVETHSKGIELEGFNLLAELPQNQGCHGISFYCRNTSLQVTKKCAEVMPFGDKAHIEYMCIELSFSLQLLIIYSSPKVSQKDALKTIIGLAESMNPSHNPLLVLGDFNLELRSAQGKALVNKMESIHLAKISPDSPSTDYRSTIDYAFASLPATSIFYESVFSDHKPMIINSEIKCFEERIDCKPTSIKNGWSLKRSPPRGGLWS